MTIKTLIVVVSQRNVHLEKKRRIQKAAVVFFLLRIKDYLTTPVPLLLITNLGAHLMLSTLDNGLTVVRKVR